MWNLVFCTNKLIELFLSSRPKFVHEDKNTKAISARKNYQN